jgi:glutaredoxin|tara:strand:- start:84 stop:473 length:390 start_codon:yes stop_codon:yes gene_type:complete
MQKKFRNLIIGLGALVVISLFIFMFYNSDDSVGANDEFAKCLTENNVKIYGAYWCPHCKDQKELFGNSWKHVDYIECSLPNNAGQTAVCSQAGIQSYPMWEFSDGSRVLGYQTLEGLSQLSNCNLNSEY